MKSRERKGIQQWQTRKNYDDASNDADNKIKKFYIGWEHTKAMKSGAWVDCSALYTEIAWNRWWVLSNLMIVASIWEISEGRVNRRFRELKLSHHHSSSSSSSLPFRLSPSILKLISWQIQQNVIIDGLFKVSASQATSTTTQPPSL